MSSHHDWAIEVISEHNQKKPFAPENGKELAFKIGDEVIYHIDGSGEAPPDGQKSFTITGLYQPQPMSSMYACGYRYMLNWDAHWMPVKESSLRLKKKAN